MTPKHPSKDLYTPMSEQVYELLQQMRLEWGSWDNVAWRAEMRVKTLNNVRKGKRKAISLTLLDRMTTRLGVGSSRDFEWYTPDELVDMGVWEPAAFIMGTKRVRRTKNGIVYDSLTAKTKKRLYARERARELKVERTIQRAREPESDAASKHDKTDNEKRGESRD